MTGSITPSRHTKNRTMMAIVRLLLQMSSSKWRLFHRLACLRIRKNLMIDFSLLKTS